MRFAALALALFVNAAAPAAAHLDLLAPPSRYGGDVLKYGPCGRIGGERSANVTVLESGTVLEVVWDEYVDHPGHYRISFDPDGDDDFADPPCLGGCKTRSPQIGLYSNTAVLLDGIADTAGGEGRATVQLPDIECERCTLQVIQVMYDKPPYEAGGNDIYYQCADLVLRRAASPTTTPPPAPHTHTPTPTAPPAACPGDCDGSGEVDVSELVRLVRIALGELALATCPAADPLGKGNIDVSDLVAAVQRSLSGCGR